MAGKNGGSWKHGWVPTNAPAALLKAHGSKTGAVRILPSIAPRRPEPKRYNVLRSLGGRAFTVSDRKTGHDVPGHKYFDRGEAAKAARKLNSADKGKAKRK